MSNKFLLVSSGRCGSHLLLSILNQHPEIIQLDEVLRNRDYLNKPPSELPNILDTEVYVESDKIIGFSTFYNELDCLDLYSYINCTKVKLIILSRRDWVAQALSFYVAKEHLNKWVWHAADSVSSDTTSIEIPKMYLKEYYEFYIRPIPKQLSKLSGDKYFVCFEDLLINDDVNLNLFNKLCQFVGCTEPLLKVDKELMTAKTPVKYNQIITNYKQCYDWKCEIETTTDKSL